MGHPTKHNLQHKLQEDWTTMKLNLPQLFAMLGVSWMALILFKNHSFLLQQQTQFMKRCDTMEWQTATLLDRNVLPQTIRKYHEEGIRPDDDNTTILFQLEESPQLRSKNITPAENLPQHRDAYPCERHMLRMYQRNECLQSHHHGAGGSGGVSECSTAAPVHLYAWYFGQGFGRIMHHSIDTCMFASVVLNRPCIIDLDVSDKYYTWRSFINEGDYHWDWRSPTSQRNITDAYLRLPSQAANQWTGDSLLQALPDYPDVLPMIWHDDWGINKTVNAASQHLAFWDGRNPATRHKILLSPSFGFAWWNHGLFPTEITKRTKTHLGCTMNHLRTLFQNAMYAPTSLAIQLFKERVTHLVGMLERGERSTKASSSSSFASSKYGAIHLRSTRSDLKKTYYDREEVVDWLRHCLESPETKDIQSWWLVSDNRTAAEYIETRIPQVHTDYPSTLHRESSSQGRNTSKLTTQAGGKKINFHSGYQMKQKYGHEYIAPSIEDFMVLHESTVAIVTHGAFGDTGARGHGKIKIKDCGVGKNHDATFKVYRKPERQ